MEAFLEGQQRLYQKIERGYESMRKRGLQFVTRGAAKVQMQAVAGYWDEFQQRHRNMLRSHQVDLNNGYLKPTF